MPTETDRTRQEAGLSAAIKRFPEHAGAMEQLMGWNDALCDMCEELAEADLALSIIGALPPSLREARTLECKDWIERLTMEIDQALRDSNVIPMRRTNRPQDR